MNETEFSIFTFEFLPFLFSGEETFEETFVKREAGLISQATIKS